MNNIRQLIFSGWHIMRFVRLAMGLFIGVNAIIMHDGLSGLLSGIFLFQAFTNSGCCGASSCAIPMSRNKQQVTILLDENKK